MTIKLAKKKQKLRNIEIDNNQGFSLLMLLLKLSIKRQEKKVNKLYGVH